MTDGPYAEAKDIVIGFSLIEAKDFDQAVKLAALASRVSGNTSWQTHPPSEGRYSLTLTEGGLP